MSMTGLAEISHAVSTENAMIQADINQELGIAKATAKAMKASDMGPPMVHAAPAASTRTSNHPKAFKETTSSSVKNIAAQKLEIAEAEKLVKAQLHKKINDHLDDPVLSPYLGHVSRPKDGASIELLKATMAQIDNAFTFNSKLTMVKNTVDGTLQVLEGGCVGFLRMNHLAGLSRRIKEKHGQQMEVCVHRIAHKISDNYTPGPELELALMFFQELSQEFSNGPLPQPAAKPPTH